MAPLLIQLPINTPGKGDDSWGSASAPEPTWDTQTPGSQLQLHLGWPCSHLGE